MVLLANYFGKEKFGEYQFILSIVLLSFIINFFVDEKYIKKLFFHSNNKNVLFNTIALKSFLNILVILISFFVIHTFEFDKKILQLFYILVIDRAVTNCVITLSFYFEYKSRSKYLAFISILCNVLTLTLQFFVIYLELSLIHLVLSILVVTIIKSTLLFYTFKKIFSLSIHSYLDLKLIREILYKSLSIGLAGISALVYSKIDQVMIGNMVGMKEVGVYSVATQIISGIMIVILPVQKSLYPKLIDLFNKDQKTYKKKYYLITFISTWLFIGSTIFIYFFFPLIFNYLFSAEYKDAIYIFYILMIGTFFMYNSILRSTHIIFIDGQKYLMFSQILSLFLNIVLNFFLIKKFGVFGAAISTSFSIFFSLFFSNIFFKETRHIFWNQFKAINIFNFKKLI